MGNKIVQIASEHESEQHIKVLKRGYPGHKKRQYSHSFIHSHCHFKSSKCTNEILLD